MNVSILVSIPLYYFTSFGLKITKCHHEQYMSYNATDCKSFHLTSSENWALTLYMVTTRAVGIDDAQMDKLLMDLF